MRSYWSFQTRIRTPLWCCMFVGTSRTGPIYKPRCPSRVFVLPSETHSSQNSSFVKARLFERIFTHRNVRGQQALMLCLSFHHHLHLLTGLIYSVVVMYSKINLGPAHGTKCLKRYFVT